MTLFDQFDSLFDVTRDRLLGNGSWGVRSFRRPTWSSGRESFPPSSRAPGARATSSYARARPLGRVRGHRRWPSWVIQSAMHAGESAPQSLAVLRLCSVFEAPPPALRGRGVRFDPVGGMQNHTAQLTRALDALGLPQDVVTHRPPYTPRRQQLGARAEVHRFGLPLPWARQFFSLPAALAALRLARTAQLVHAHQGEDLALLPIAMGAARTADIPLVVTLHTSLRHTFRGDGLRRRLLGDAGGRIESMICRRADAVIALTARLAAALEADGVHADRIHVIPPGVNTREFSGPQPDPFPELPHPRIVFVGRLAYQKGVETLVQAATLMRRTDSQIVLVGDGPLRADVERAITTAGLEDRMKVVGFRHHNQIPAILRHSDVFCLPSRFEELSSALLEAMHVGLPIVATRVGGIPETLGSAGILVHPEDPASLADSLDKLLSERALADRLATMARERGRAYDWSGLAQRVLGVYQTVLAHRRPGEAGLDLGRRGPIETAISDIPGFATPPAGRSGGPGA